MAYQTTIAKIDSTQLGYEDHGIFSLVITFSYGSSSQGFGPIAVTDTNLIQAILHAANVDCWEELKRRTVYAVRDEGYTGLVRGMAPLPTERGKGFVLEDGKVLPFQPGVES